MNAIIFSAIWGVLMMFSGIFIKTKAVIRNLAIAGVAILLLLNLAELNHMMQLHINVRNMLVFDSFGLLFNSVAFASTLIYLLLSAKDVEDVGVNQAEYFALIFFVLSGVAIASSFNTLLMLFLGIEIISIPLYILTGSDKRNLKGNEASLKYFLMGSFSTGIMLMGIALIYGATGSFAVENMSRQLDGFGPIMTAGLLLLLVAMSFKVSAAPFHFWTPDVYDGAPTVFTSFMATIVKAGVFIAFVRLFDAAYGASLPQWRLTIAVIIAATLFIGNITAVFQQSVKRMLAYSSIAQAGFMFFALFGYNEIAREGIILYAAAYSLATIGIFAILIKMNDYTFDGYNGLAKQQPLLAATNTIFLLSLAGIPATAGFFAKYYMLMAAIKNGAYMWLVIFAVLCAAVSVYYYFRVIQAMYFKDGNGEVKTITPQFKWVLAILAGVVIILGLFPQLLLVHLYFYWSRILQTQAVKPTGQMKIVIISDTHGQHARLKLPPGDLLIHAGDVSKTGGKTDAVRFLNWFSTQPFPHKIFIAGNHDLFFEKEPAQQIHTMIPPGIVYLNDSGTTVNGFHIWGSPVTPWFQNWAFNRHHGNDINRHWNLIPTNTNILITHGPPYGILDKNAEGQHIGCKDLLRKVQEIKPRLHIFGHIHESYGTNIKEEVQFINASVLNEQYQLANAPIIIEME